MELEKIKEMEVPVMSQAINAYYTITASSEFREKERLRAKARHDEAQALYNADRNAKIGIARKVIGKTFIFANMSITFSISLQFLYWPSWLLHLIHYKKCR